MHVGDGVGGNDRRIICLWCGEVIERYGPLANGGPVNVVTERSGILAGAGFVHPACGGDQARTLDLTGRPDYSDYDEDWAKKAYVTGYDSVQRGKDFDAAMRQERARLDAGGKPLHSSDAESILLALGTQLSWRSFSTFGERADLPEGQYYTVVPVHSGGEDWIGSCLFSARFIEPTEVWARGTRYEITDTHFANTRSEAKAACEIHAAMGRFPQLVKPTFLPSS